MSNEPNIIYIGRKNPMNYVLALVTSFSTPNTDKITLKARGNAISTAIDVAEIARRKFLKNVEIEDITTGTEELDENGIKRRVSTIEITLKQ